MREKLEKLQSLRNVVQAVSALRPEKGEDGESNGRTTLLVTEHPRAALDALMLLAAAPMLRKAPMGDGHGVLVLPGMLTGDGFTRPMRGFLTNRGYVVRGWDLGRNVGPTREVLRELPRTLAAFAEETGGPVSIVGWSMGGVFARHLAASHGDQVRQVITFGTPAPSHQRDQTRADQRIKFMEHVTDRATREYGVPSTSIYSRNDGFVDPHACHDEEGPMHENVEVRCAHIGFPLDAATMWVVADRLARPAGSAAPFVAPSLLSKYLGQAQAA
ncbi:MAG: hypothetical protein KBB39_04870 [Phycicoccus sp.]|nr:hypothetical protein [Phycicoccus sp.]